MLNQIICKSGSYVEIVPIGLLCTIEYGETGILEKIYTSYSDNLSELDLLDSNLTFELKKHNIVPQRIMFTQGITHIKGVFYTKKLFKKDGCLPECIKQDMISDLYINMMEYTFYAGHMENNTYNFNGPSNISTHLRTFGFNVIPGHVVYDLTNGLPIKYLMSNSNYPFEYPLISGVMVYENITNWKYIPANLSQCYVKNTDNYLDEYGNIRTIISTSKNKLYKSYTEIVHNDVQSKSILILDGFNIVYTYKPNKLFRSKIPNKLHCDICGKALTVPASGFTHCHDDHCPSRIYPIIQHFIEVLNLPKMPFDVFLNHIKTGKIYCLIDILLLDEYKDIQIECTLSKLLFSVVPIELCRNIEYFQQFVNHLGSIKAFDYYIENPDAIISDLSLNPIYSKNFANWLKDPSNIVELKSLMDCEQIKINPVHKKFEGLPILRNKTICVTGKFIHGTLEDIISIIQSYSGKVVTSFDNSVSFVVVGHFENEDPNIIELAIGYHIPVYGEDDFFRYYGIDADMVDTSSNIYLE